MIDRDRKRAESYPHPSAATALNEPLFRGAIECFARRAVPAREIGSEHRLKLVAADATQRIRRPLERRAHFHSIAHGATNGAMMGDTIVTGPGTDPPSATDASNMADVICALRM